MAEIVVRLDDIHPRMNRDKFDRFVSGVEASGHRGVLGVVPDCQDPKLMKSPEDAGFWDLARSLKDRGWVIAQHGFTHVYDNTAPTLLVGNSRSEFAGHSLDEQLARLQAGAAILREQNLAADVFMAPAHSFDANTLVALERSGFRFVTDGHGFWPYRVGALTLVPQMAARPHGFPFGVYTTCFHLDNMSDAAIDGSISAINAHHVVGFYEAASLRPAAAASLLRSASAFALRTLRRLRHAR